MVETLPPGTGPVYALLAHSLPGNTPACFSACAGGLFVTHDLGLSWKYAYQSLLGDSLLPTLALAKAALGDGSGMLLAGTPGAVLRSVDDGLNWQVARLPEPEPVVTALAVSPNFVEDGTALAATDEDGIFISTNRGSSWVAWNFGLIDMHILSLAVSPAFSRDHRVFAGVSSGLFHSANGGRSWQPVELPGGYDAVLSLVLSPAFAADGTGFAGTENHGLLRTTDGGATWQPVGTPLINGALNGLAIDPDFHENHRLAALADTQLLSSNDNGDHWTTWMIKALPGEFDVTALAAPEGLGSGQPVWLGSSDGRVVLL